MREKSFVVNRVGKQATPAAQGRSRRVAIILTLLIGIALSPLFALAASGDSASSATPNGPAVPMTARTPTRWPSTPSIRLNQQFIQKGVKLVVAVGDITDKGTIEALDTRAAFAQALYNAGVGFYPLRGNHESKTSGGRGVPADFPPDAKRHEQHHPGRRLQRQQPRSGNPAHSHEGRFDTFIVGANFSSPSANLAGLSYAFDYNNARFVLLDQFMPTDGKASDGSDVRSEQQCDRLAADLDQQHVGRQAGRRPCLRLRPQGARDREPHRYAAGRQPQRQRRRLQRLSEQPGPKRRALLLGRPRPHGEPGHRHQPGRKIQG